ncbi:phage Gp37/Gp68 family protein [Streptosporangium sp. NPDC000563]|uniref:DUF5131 family protein n=1 Tax=Streptosporangium sp. NPDC000563 TaxID=3154366 RepID=UPI003328EC16
MAVTNSSIEWTDSTWSPVTGCTKVSPGCDNCYAEGIARRFSGTKAFPNGFEVTLRPERLDQPLRWKKPRRIFVNSMSDLFHDAVPDEYIARVFAVMAATPDHTFQLLTKRHGRMRSLLSSTAFVEAVQVAFDALADEHEIDLIPGPWPLSNVHLGVSVEDQKWADRRIPALLDTPASVRWISAEPLLGPVDLCGPIVNGHRPRLTYWLTGRPGWGNEYTTDTGITMTSPVTGPRLDWVVCGGESGHGARPMHPDWARSLRDQCVAAGVAFHFKQYGDWVAESMWLHRDTAPAAFLSTDGTTRPLVNGKPTAAPMSRGKDITIRRVGKKAAGRELDGRTWDEMPAEVAR